MAWRHGLSRSCTSSEATSRTSIDRVVTGSACRGLVLSAKAQQSYSTAGSRLLAEAGRAQVLAHALELLAVDLGQPPQQRFPGLGQANVHLTAVVPVLLAAHQPALLGAVDQSHRAVMVQLHPLGELGDVGVLAPRIALDGQHQLVLLRRNASLTCRLFAEPEEPPDRIAVFRHSLEIGLADPLTGHLVTAMVATLS